jgi:hypothetical protein
MLRATQLTGFNTGGSYFKDNFNDNSLNTNLWTKTFTVFAGLDAAVTVVETGGATVITPINSSGSHYNGLESVKTFNLSNGAFAACSMVPSGATQDNNEGRFALFLDTSNYLSFAAFGTTPVLSMRIRTAGVNDATTITYNATTHKYWRFLRSGSDVLFQTSSDNVSWTTRRTVTPSFSLASFKVCLFAGTFAAVASPITYTFDDVLTNLK